ncbi:biotin transporter BioY [Jannaschia aquimarina]|uniref:Biotin transporter n=1 Tax=Jannaschia aquimarina TaxID=935700 RepID=A0A0D1EI12_9RHOB|nr:biotin transporter BioY [Jannaschia aquimarina]KIT17264.1 Biotin transporter BioY [Jannaschia aquimarina]SNT19291.1 biotin transport system substrate-specific component [Jannaschia aquimarina]
MTLTARAFGQMTLPKQVAIAIAGSALIAIAAKIQVPMFPVPMTLQVLTVLFVGLAFGARLGAATVALYLAEGLAGLPVFTTTTPPGPAAFAGPTAGFLVGFVPMAFVAGLAAGCGWLAMIAACVAATAVLYVFGMAWPLGLATVFGIQAGWAALAPAAAFGAFMVPFLIGDAVKIALAVLLAAGGRALLRR